jgi:hypothetical protein
MSEVRERYYECLEGWGFVNPEAKDYITELEQQITELKESQKQKQIIKLCERLDKAEQQNEQMIEALRMIKHKLETDPAITDTIWIDDTPKCSETAVDRINYLLGIKE